MLKLLQKPEELFYGTLSTWKKIPVDFELKEDANLICSIPYQVLKVQKEISKKEVERLVLIGFLELAYDSEWGSPSFEQPKP